MILKSLFLYLDIFIQFQKTNLLWFLLVVLSGFVIFIGSLRHLSKHQRMKKLLVNFPGPRTLPLFGNALLLYKENHEYFQLAEDLVRDYGKLCKVWLFNKPYVIISDANVVEKVLSSKVNLEKADDMQVFCKWWGSGLLTASAIKWKSQRKLLNPTFCHSILMEFMDIFNQESFSLMKSLDNYSESQKSFNLIPYTTACTLNIICETAMGKKLYSDGHINQEYIDAVTGMYHILVARMTRPWLRPDFIWNLSSFGQRENKYLKILHGFTDKVIAEKKAARLKARKVSNNSNPNGNDIEGKKVRKAFMDYLLDLADDGNIMTDTDIRNEVDTFMAAGHDTTAYTISWTLFLLATYPEHQIKVQQELDEIFENDKTRPVSGSDLSKMTHLGLCIKEALRIYPIVPFNFRRIVEDVKCDGGKTIPAGVNVVIMPYVIHKDPKYFLNPEAFQPERFMAENCIKRHPFAYIPFSAGPRNCIGQKFGVYEAKVILSYLLGSYKWETIDSRESVKLDLDLVIRPMDGLNFKISKR